MIKNVGEMDKILTKFDATDWVRSAQFEGGHRLDMNNGISAPSEASQKTFTEFLTQSLSEVNELQQEANKSVERLVSGESQALHETMLAVEEAEIAFKTMNQIRQKVLDAYREVMKIQI